jgi:hypothetical protein
MSLIELKKANPTVDVFGFKFSQDKTYFAEIVEEHKKTLKSAKQEDEALEKLKKLVEPKDQECQVKFKENEPCCLPWHSAYRNLP